MRLQLFALAYNPADFLRTPALPDAVAQGSLTTVREKLVKACPCARGDRRPDRGPRPRRRVQLAEVAEPRALFAAILRRIDRLRGPPVPAT